jgi:uncharacterized RDD family membrane protein YckC
MKPKVRARPLKDLERYCANDWQLDQNTLLPGTPVQRWYAVTIDLALSFPLYLVLLNPFERTLERLNSDFTSQKFGLLVSLLIMIPWFGYYFLPTLIWGQTLGKRAVGLRVISYNGRRGLLQIFFRESIGKLLSVGSFGLGVMLALIHPRRLMLHDLLSSTSVVASPNTSKSPPPMPRHP